MSADPALPTAFGNTPGETSSIRTAQRLSAIEKRLDVLEQNPPPIPVITGTPGGSSPRPGAPVVDDGAPAGTIRLGLYVPSRGGFKWTTLT